jgi:hypothetical protein
MKTINYNKLIKIKSLASTPTFEHEYHISNVGDSISKNQPVIFCTGHFHSNPKRYQDWIDYYSEKTKSFNVRLLISHDGPIRKEIDLKKCILIYTNNELGRLSKSMPGWRRSFANALHYLKDKTNTIGHVESDLYIINCGFHKYMNLLTNSNDYISGFCNKYNFMESGIQIFNSASIEYFLDKMQTVAGLYTEDYEPDWENDLKPVISLYGDRLEGQRFRGLALDDYIAQASIDDAIYFSSIYESMNKNRSDLQNICKKYKTDKLSHGYIQFYESHFSDIRYDNVTLLELGVIGDEQYNTESNYFGDSLKVFRDYFKNGKIYGIDISATDRYKNEERIETIKCDVNNRKELVKSIESINSHLDIVIDDCSHVSSQIIESFKTIFPYLKPNGWYIIEDLQTSYLDGYGGNERNLIDQKTSINFIKSLVDSVNGNYILEDMPLIFRSEIRQISIYPKIVFIQKK